MELIDNIQEGSSRHEDVGDYAYESLRKFRDRLRILIILYTFCERGASESSEIYGIFRTEIKIQAIDFLLRYPDFLSLELMDLYEESGESEQRSIESTIFEIYENDEPQIRVEEMEKFFFGAYEEIDEIVLFLKMVGFLRYESRRRSDGREFDKVYYVTKECVEKVEGELHKLPALQWYFQRCSLIRRFFGQFSGSELKDRQYRYREYSSASYKSRISNVNDKVRLKFLELFGKELKQ